MDEDQRAEIAALSRVGAAPRTITAALKGNNPAYPITIKDVYNARMQIRTEALKGRTPIQALVEELEEENFLWKVETDVNGHVTHLLFAAHKAISLFKMYPEVLLMDCTYKTNRFKMPLLNIVGLTGLGTTFYVAFAFLRAEQENDYTWALQQLKSFLPVVPRLFITDRELALMNAISAVFPDAGHLLCQWHIQKNILAKCKRYFSSDTDESDLRAVRLVPSTGTIVQSIASTGTVTATVPTSIDPWTEFQRNWTTVIRTQTSDDFEKEWKKMKETYKHRIFAIRYIEAVWMPWKERFAYPWADKYMHFGTIVTSRVESAYAALKRYLEIRFYYPNLSLSHILTPAGINRRPPQSLPANTSTPAKSALRT